MLHRIAVGSTAILAVLKLIGYGAFVWLGALTLERALLIDLIGHAVIYIFMRIMYARTMKDTAPAETFRPDRAEKKRLLRYGLLNNFNDLGTLFITMKLDYFFVAAFLNPVAVGIYAFYVRLNEMVSNWLPTRLFQNVIQPLFFAMPREKANRQLPEYFSLLVNANLVLQWPVLMFAIAYNAELVNVVFGGKFIEYSWLLPIVVLFATINVIAIPVTLVAQYEERAGIILLSKIFGAYNVAVLALLVPWWGIAGAVLATGSAEALKNLFIWYFVRHQARWIRGGLAVASGVALWGGALAVCFFLKSSIPAPQIVQLAIGVAICGLTVLLHLRSPAISNSDKALLGAVLGGREKKLLTAFGVLKSG